MKPRSRPLGSGRVSGRSGMARGAPRRPEATRALQGPCSAGGWTADVELNSGLQGTPPAPLFYWDDGATSPGPAILITSFNNTIFQRPNSSDDDFTADLAALLVEDLNSGPPYYSGTPSAIGWSGLRAEGVGALGPPFMITSSPSPFLGPMDPASRSLEQWFIDNQAGTVEFYTTPTWLNAGAALSEDDNDVEGFPRPPVASGLRDKGGEED